MVSAAAMLKIKVSAVFAEALAAVAIYSTYEYLTDIQSSSSPSNRSSNVFYCTRYLRYFLRLKWVLIPAISDPPYCEPACADLVVVWDRARARARPVTTSEQRPHIAGDSSRSHSLQVTQASVIRRFVSLRCPGMFENICVFASISISMIGG